ncbi:putative non-structural maintenance of chromosomes element 4 [[Candida] jaroonii]|uniref:Non-structural maintenance of chromosomes element 4 n=1 Tax=[Candida] jaroonii TaxID=467808 RepID=A0ACA9Y213_9ASCO|nr:putative non-structural maintenance of chromosomes element 4 [[Candida] jaroonii]
MTSEAEIRSSDSSIDENVENGTGGSTSQRRMAKVPTNIMVQDYDKYRKHLKESGLLAFKGEGTTALLENLHELQGLYDNYHKTSSMTVHFSDAQALNDTSNYAAVNAKNLKLGDMGTSLTTKEFTHRLSEFLFDSSLGNGASLDNEPDLTTEERFNQFDWLKLGLLFYNTSSKPIPMEFLNGPLETEKKVRNRRKAVDDTRGIKNTTTAEQLDVDDLEYDEQNTAHLVREIYRTVDQKQSDDGAVNFFKFFIDPNSFSQSVENLFLTSFLIRDARLKLTVIDDVPMVSKVDNEEFRKVMRSDKSKTDTSHHIASFDYETWQELVQQYNITESYLGHRDIEGEAFDEADEDSSDEDEEIEDYGTFQNGHQVDDSPGQEFDQESEEDSDQDSDEQDSDEQDSEEEAPVNVKRRKLNS